MKPTFAQPTAQQIRKRKIKTTSKYKERLCCCFLGLFRYLLKPFLFNSFDVGDGRLMGALRAYLVASFALVPLKNKKKTNKKTNNAQSRFSLAFLRPLEIRSVYSRDNRSIKIASHPSIHGSLIILPVVNCYFLHLQEGDTCPGLSCLSD